ncbi:MAG: hypothetical protein ABF379_08695 [Akkermansiaceae bacterium]|jgi:hypothetical protein
MTETPQASKISGIKITLAVVPALLIVSVCIALYLGATADQEESKPFEGEITVPEMSNYLLKLNSLIGEREIGTEIGQKAFRQLNAMTAGTLGSENLGYEVHRSQIDSANGLLWSTIWIKAGDRDSRKPVVVAIPQASRGSGPAFGFGFAEYLTSHQTEVGVRIVFYPPLVEGDLDDWIWERCGGEGESMKGFVMVTGDEDSHRSPRFLVPDSLEETIDELSRSEIWSDDSKVETGDHPVLEVRLGDDSLFSREEHSQRLIRMMPVIKELVESLNQ